MKKQKILVTLLSIVSLAVFAEVGNKDLDEIRGLTKAGLYEQALQKHIWFHEESKNSPGMGGVRLSYALEAWVELSKKYPPAETALINLRDNYKKKLLSGSGTFEDFHDLSSINQYMKEEDETYRLFLFLHKEHPEQAGRYYHVVEGLLIERKEYEICGKYIADPLMKYEDIRHMRELNISLAKKEPGLDKPHFQKYTNESFIDGVSKLIEVLVALERVDEAKEIQKRALSYFESEKIKYAIP